MRLTSAARRGAMTPALPMPYPALDASGLRLRRGQVSLTVAAPGVGKSMVWQNMAGRMGVPTLYWSADTDQHDVYMRALASLTGASSDQIDEYYRSGEKAVAYYQEKVQAVNHIDWIFDSSIPVKKLAERLAAFAEIRGEYPQLVVLDNLSNAVEHQEQEMAEQKQFIVETQRLARFTRAHMAILAHAEGKFDDGVTPIPQSGVYNKLSKLPEVVITFHRADAAAKRLGVNVVKQRGGRADPGAVHPTYLNVDYSTAFVGVG